MDRTALYRHFDASGVLLYVGIAVCPLSRQKAHTCGAHWYGDIASISIEWHHTREQALAAEIDAIRQERPLHNIAGVVRKSATPIPPTWGPRPTKKLSARGVEAANAVGMYGDGDGLYLQITTGCKSWIFRFRLNGKRREMGLGSIRDVSLAEARQRASDARAMVARGLDPIDRRRELMQAWADYLSTPPAA